MRLNLLEKLAFGAALLVVGLTVTYRYVLSDEQRDALQEGADVVRNAVDEVTDSVSKGPSKREEEAAAEENRAKTNAQWEAIGI